MIKGPKGSGSTALLLLHRSTVACLAVGAPIWTLSFSSHSYRMQPDTKLPDCHLSTPLCRPVILSWVFHAASFLAILLEWCSLIAHRVYSGAQRISVFLLWSWQSVSLAFRKDNSMGLNSLEQMLSMNKHWLFTLYGPIGAPSNYPGYL